MQAGIARTVALGIGLVCVIGLGIVAIWALAPRDRPSTAAGLTEVKDPAELEKMLAVSPPSILTSTNYLGHKVYTVRATLKNISTMPIRLVDAKMTFLDYNKGVVHEDVRPAFEARPRALEPGGEHQMELAFENPPNTWNYHVPEIHVVRVAY